jgi:hypothetical protein
LHACQCYRWLGEEAALIVFVVIGILLIYTSGQIDRSNRRERQEEPPLLPSVCLQTMQSAQIYWAGRFGRGLAHGSGDMDCSAAPGGKTSGEIGWAPAGCSLMVAATPARGETMMNALQEPLLLRA